MLVLTRKRLEGFTIHTSNGKIEVVIMGTGKDVRIGIDAPKDCKILRNELEEKEDAC